jgi:cyclopropane-fatty-acyl-phospholipid synthase
VKSHEVARARRVVTGLFGPSETRDFSVEYWDGSKDLPGISSESAFTLCFRRPGALRRMLLPPSELAITEAFIAGDVDLEGSAEHAMHLGDVIGSRMQSPGGFAGILRDVLALPRDRYEEEFNAAAASRYRSAHEPGGTAAIQHHYDAGNDFYRLWLDDRMVYSCAYFREPDEALAQAQLNKLDLICRKLRLAPGMDLLDIGCGWGALIIHAAQEYGVRATGITLSEAQAALARERIAAAGLASTCRVELLDYRELASAGQFDRIASVGMMEHVGDARLPGYFAAAYQALRPGGLFLNHAIVIDGHRQEPTIRDRVLSRLWKRGEFINRHVFPDGQLVPVATMIERAERAGFELRDVEAMRQHYTITLRHWLRALEGASARAIELAGERRYRTWRLYLLAAINGFRAGNTNIVQALFAKNRSDGTSEIPLTRAHLFTDHDHSGMTSTRSMA